MNIQYCDNIQICNNTIICEEFGNRGIYLYQTQNSNISNNYLKDSYRGISLSGEDCQGTIINNNTIMGNILGLYVQTCKNSNIYKSHFQDNKYSIILSSTRDTFIEKNNFIRSEEQHSYICWVLFPKNQKPKDNEFDSNYWDDIGISSSKRIPIRLTIFDALFPIQITYSFSNDRNPANEPYDIPLPE